MKRKAEPKRPGEIQWLNKGGTLHMRSGRIIKPMQKFKAHPDEIPQAFRDVIVPVDPVTQISPLPVEKPGYSLRETDEGLYEIVDARGKAITEDPQPKDRAEAILSRLTGE